MMNRNGCVHVLLCESEVCESDLVKVAMRGNVGVHGGLSHWDILKN